MKATRKRIIISGEFDTEQDLKESLLEIWRQIKAGHQNVKLTKNGMDFKAMAHELIEDLDEAKESERAQKIIDGMKWQEIEGKQCLIIPSRMNYEQDN